MLILIVNNSYGQKIKINPALYFRDINRNIHQVKKNKINVFIFLDTECPISQRYTSKLESLISEIEKSSPNTIAFYTVFPTKGLTTNDIRIFNNKYYLKIASLLDKNHIFTKMLDATITPEVFVIDQSGMIKYQGAIDNWYYQLGKARVRADSLFLKNALLSLLMMKKVEPNLTKAVGCDIER